ncbi:C-reactive protein 1.1-like [Limulus polyphemus]|uniref:Pentraxin family member n=1 Tax=Limulus polyphemus TaxID=6850 RepID=A0ABM1BS76_LIMPO|nr:C-reactive protein 1.1-like [Limulus polyphemus]
MKIGSETEYPFSYATERFHNELLTFVEPSINGHPFVGLYIHKTSNRLAVKCPSSIVGEWHHVCYTWRSVDGQAQVYVNPHKDSCDKTVTGFAVGKVVQASGTLSLGQEQSYPGGGLSLDQSFDGEYTDVNVWSEALDVKQIFRVSKCLGCGVDRCCNHKEEELTGDVVD